MWDLWWTALMIFSEYSSFLCQFIFHRLLHTHHHRLLFRAGTIDPNSDRRNKWTVSPHTKKKKGKKKHVFCELQLETGSRCRCGSFFLSQNVLELIKKTLVILLIWFCTSTLDFDWHVVWRRTNEKFMVHLKLKCIMKRESEFISVTGQCFFFINILLISCTGV
jgi:hypothetical protein